MTEVLRSYVDGVWRDGVRTVQRTDPAHPATVVAEASLADAALATDAVLAARKAAPAWRATPPPARGEILRRAADAAESYADALAMANDTPFGLSASLFTRDLATHWRSRGTCAQAS